MKTDIKKRTTEAQRWQKKAKKIRSGAAAASVASGGGGSTGVGSSAANQELLRAADAAQNDLNSRLALLQVRNVYCCVTLDDYFLLFNLQVLNEPWKVLIICSFVRFNRRRRNKPFDRPWWKNVVVIASLSLASNPSWY